jgi:hypothetical protein
MGFEDATSIQLELTYMAHTVKAVQSELTFRHFRTRSRQVGFVPTFLLWMEFTPLLGLADRMKAHILLPRVVDYGPRRAPDWCTFQYCRYSHRLHLMLAMH